MNTEFEEFDVSFKIVSNKNKNVYCEGYVTINDEDAEDVDWYYWTGNGYDSRPYYHHDSEQITGLTQEQSNEIEQFKIDYAEDSLWIDTVILQSDDDENRTHIRKNCTLIINEGAKMECEILEDVDQDNEYIVEVIPKFNGKKINLAEYMSATWEVFDPYDENGYCEIENGHIFFEISKNYFDEDLKEEEMELVNEEACKLYARSLTYNMGIYSKYGDVLEQALDGDYDEDWLLRLSQHENDTKEELDKFFREEGFILTREDY